MKKVLCIIGVLSVVCTCMAVENLFEVMQNAGFQPVSMRCDMILKDSDDLFLRVIQRTDGLIERIKGAPRCLVDEAFECPEDLMPVFSQKQFREAMSKIEKVRSLGKELYVAKAGTVQNSCTTYLDLYENALLVRETRPRFPEDPTENLVHFEVYYENKISGIVNEKRAEPFLADRVSRLMIDNRWFFVKMSPTEFKELTIGSQYGGLAMGPIDVGKPDGLLLRVN